MALRFTGPPVPITARAHSTPRTNKRLHRKKLRRTMAAMLTKQQRLLPKTVLRFSFCKGNSISLLANRSSSQSKDNSHLRPVTALHPPLGGCYVSARSWRDRVRELSCGHGGNDAGDVTCDVSVERVYKKPCVAYPGDACCLDARRVLVKHKLDSFVCLPSIRRGERAYTRRMDQSNEGSHLFGP
eukprot:687729-Pyramimonas_sp.AAC.1